MPVPKLWRSINPSDTHVEKFTGEESRRRNMAEEILPVIRSKKIALFLFSVVAAAGIALTSVCILSILSILATGGPFPGTIWVWYDDFLTPMWQYVEPAIIGSMELVVFGLFLSILFGVLAVRNFSKMKMLQRMLARANKSAIKST